MSLLLRLLLFIYLLDFNTRSKPVNIYFCFSFCCRPPCLFLFFFWQVRDVYRVPLILFSRISLFLLTLFLLLNSYETNISIIKVFLSFLHGILSFSFVWLLNTDMHPPIDSPHIYTHTFKSSTFLPSAQASPSPLYSLPCTRKLTLTFPRHNSF